ncbi:protein EMBRYONIC FLOWER 1-like [Hibiscus syriacus]|nr:protein EMBRYONIC FLOWER 1-like [Hibiscus syriacus]
MWKTLGFDEKVASLQLRNPDLKDNEVAGVKVPESNVECTVKDATETRQTGKSACDQQMELVRGSGSHGIASTVHRVPNAIKNHTDEHPSSELGDCDYASSESDEVLPGTVSGSLHRRKNHKVRLLTELLGTNDDGKTNLTSTEDSPSSTIPDASIGMDSISTSQGHVNFHGSVTSSLARRKKRKIPQDEEWVPGEFMCSPNNGHKNFKTINRDAESVDGITSSDSEGTINRSSSQAPAKSNLVNAKVEKGPILGKKKSKKTEYFDELHLSRENLQKERQKKPPGDTTKNDASDIVLYKSNDVSTGGGLNPFPESALKAKKKYNLLKKKSKMHQDHDCQASRIPWNNGNVREGPISRKDVETRQTGNLAVLLEVTQDTSATKGLQFSPNNSLSATSYDAKYSTPIRDGQGHVLSEYDTGGKDLNMNYVSQADPNVWKGMHVDLNSNHTAYKIPFLNEMQKDISPAEVGSSSIQLMDFNGTSNNGRTVKFRDHATVAREHYDKRVEMASEQEAADDIMEIVELMAKNQYERCLPDTEIDKQLPEISNAKNHLMVDLNKAYGNEEMDLFQETIKQNTAQNCQWIGNMVGQKSSHANVRASGICKTSQGAPQQNKEAAHLWLSMMPNSMPYIPSVPHKCADQLPKLDMLRHCPSNLPKGNMSQNDDRDFLNLDSNYEKPRRKFDSEALRRTHADYPFTCKHNGTGLLDLYSNETIPAMHLLSLMDAGLQSGAPVDGNQRVVKKTSFLSGGYRTTSMKHPSFDCYGKSHLPESFCECMSVTEADGPSTSFQDDKSFKGPEFTGHFSLNSREKEKKKCSDSQRQNKNHKSNRSVSSNSGLNTTCGSIPVHSMPKLALGTSEFMMFPGKLHVMESATKHKQKTRTSSGTLFHPKSGSENDICGINRNPADFTIPGAGNMYMIDGEDLKFGREKAPSSGLVKLIGHKCQRKLTVRKEHSRN